MECPMCGCWAPDDPETGYGADSLCPSCQADGFTETAQGELVNDQDEADVDAFEQVRR